MLDKTSVPSPCIRNCCLDGDDICLGCFRHVDEIVEWGAATDERRQKILALADSRKENKRKLGELWAPRW
jgi:predicted Fe-S protein YdhL (DUF1289 family)